MDAPSLEMSNVDVVDAVYAGVFSGTPEDGLAHCAPGAQWHPMDLATIGSVPEWWRWGEGRQSLETYLTEILPAAAQHMDGYAVTQMDRDTIGDLVVTRVRSTHGAGVMLFRVVRGKLCDIWVFSGTDSFF